MRLALTWTTLGLIIVDSGRASQPTFGASIAGRHSVSAAARAARRRRRGAWALQRLSSGPAADGTQLLLRVGLHRETDAVLRRYEFLVQRFTVGHKYYADLSVGIPRRELCDRG